ncbi:hypothetical protein F3087_24025 [Nocardia colli]|uniref:Uncharacterized protein n=1 Tax=Nocardia colli TaxID=2545717 RepID=A0A5N0EDE5_9NOCA|nr:hypothetical protein F3087_24025 [Nocardia colli]
MTSIHIDHRISRLETRVTDIEEHYGETHLTLTRRVAGLEIVTGRSFALLMERLGVPPAEIAKTTVATAAEIDAVLEEDC